MHNTSTPLDLCVVIPVYNEAEIIGRVLDIWAEKLDRLVPNSEIHIYNDGSKDGSLAASNAAAARHPRVKVHDKPNSGHGPTILLGYRENANATWIFQTDSDNEIDHAHFEELWEQREDYDLLIGKRVNRQAHPSRQFISLVSRLVVWIFYGRGVYDVNAPFRLMRGATFRPLYDRIPEDTFAPNIIVAGVACQRKWRVFQTDVSYQFRTTGKVSIMGLKLLKNVIKAFKQVIGFRFMG
jgi:glycosyltransferase involved in cell wall biosynthesis